MRPSKVKSLALGFCLLGGVWGSSDKFAWAQTTTRVGQEITASTQAASQPVAQTNLLPIPDAAARQRALAIIRNLFKTEYAQRAIPERAALAKRLLQEANGTTDDATARYVLFDEALTLATDSGELTTALEAINALESRYQVDGLNARVKALGRLKETAAPGPAAELVALASLNAVDLAVAEDHFEQANALAKIAEDAAARSRRVAFVVGLQPRITAYRQLFQEYTQAQQALATLKDHPDDAPAHHTVGRFYAWSKGDWPKGLPYLARGTDAAVVALAQKELALTGTNSDPLKYLEAGDGWWELAEKYNDPVRVRMKDHAAVLYRIAQRGITGLTLTRIGARIQENETKGTTGGGTNLTTGAKENSGSGVTVGGHGSQVGHVPGGINLLPLVNVTKDAEAGDWKIKDGALGCDVGKYARVALPYIAPEEYDLRVTFTRTDSDGPIALLLTGRGTEFEWAMDVKGEARFERIANKINEGNPTRVPCKLENAKRYLAVVQVRRDGLKAFLDDKLIGQWKTDHKDLSRYSLWKLKDDRVLGVGANHAGVVFHQIEVVEVTGRGKGTR